MKAIFITIISACMALAFSTPGRGQKPALVVQTGHSGLVSAVAFSPDSRLLASGSWDNSIKIWDVATGEQLRTLTGHTQPVTSIALSSDGKTLASGSYDYTAKLWDVGTGRLLHTLTGHSLAVESIALSPDGKLLATGSLDNTIKLWDVNSGRELATLTGHSANVSAVAFGPGGKTLASGSWDHSVRIWDVASHQVIRAFEGHPGAFMSVAFSANGKLLAAGGWQGIIKLWDVDSGQERYTFSAHAEWVYPTAFSPDSRILASGSNDAQGRTVKFWDVTSGQELSTSFRHRSSALSLAYSPDGRTLAVGGDDHTITLVDTATRAEAAVLKGHTHALASVAFSPDGKLMASAGRENNVKLWDVEDQTSIRNLAGHSAEVTSVAFSPRGRILATGSYDRTIKLWDASTGQELRTLTGHSSSVNCLAFSPDGKLIASGGGDHSVRLWEVETGRLLRTLAGHLDFVQAVAFSPPDGNILASASADTTMKLWNIASGEEIRTLEGHSNWVRALSFSPDGKTIATGSVDQTIKLWNAETGRELRTLTGHGSAVETVAFSPDGRSLASGSWDRTIKLWDLSSGKPIRTLSGHAGAVVSLAFLHQGRFLVSGGLDAEVKLWTVPGENLATLTALDDHDWAVVTPEGRFDASPDGMELMHWVVGNEPVYLSQLKERYYEPALLSKLLGFNQEALRNVSAFEDVKLYPAVEYDPPAPNSTKFSIKLMSRGGGVGRVQVFVNGKELPDEARGLRMETGDRQTTLTVDLSGAPVVPGQPNLIRVVAWNADGYLSSHGEIREWTPAGTADTRAPQLYAIVAGISDYSSPALHLRFAAKDAEDMARALQIGASRLLGPGNVHLTLLSSSKVPGAIDPTKANFIKAFSEAREAKPWDILLVYLSGHGVAIPGTGSYFYLTRDARQFNDLDDPAVRSRATITSDELVHWINLVPALKQIMVLDTCAAGAAADKLMEKRGVPGDQIRAIERLKDRTGFHVLMGCAADASSYEANQYGQGLLTYTLLQGMKGAALRDDEYVDVSRLFQYAADQVPKLAINIGGIQKPLVAAPKGTSFDIGRLEQQDKADIPLAMVKPLILRPVLINPEEGVDNLGLMAALRRSLNDEGDVGRRGSDDLPSIVYIDTDELPGAVRPTGTYTIEAQKVVVRLVLSRDGQKMAHTEIGGSTDNLKSLVDDISRAIRREVQKLRSRAGERSSPGA